MKQSGKHRKNTTLCFLGHADGLKGTTQLCKLRRIVDSRHLGNARHSQVAKGGGATLEAEGILLVVASNQLIEGVIVPLSGGLERHARFFKQVVLGHRAEHLPLL